MTAPSQFQYAGSELTLFEKARHWKAYWRDRIAPFVCGDVLEVGAGIGANTRVLAELNYRQWTCLEPDAGLAAQIDPPTTDRHQTVVGTIARLPPQARFDTILYIDVLEHIEDDRAEVERAGDRLKPDGALIILSPAHPFLYTPFDAGIGHFRRYTRSTLCALMPPTLRACKVAYLDSAGMLASAANRVLLKSAMPTERQILTWDRWLVPVSRVTDGVFGGRLGKSILGIWRRDALHHNG
jgi:SAM-dependent methyltransferase